MNHFWKDVKDDKEKLIALCACCINLLIFLPITLFYAFRFYKRSKNVNYSRYYETRNKTLIIVWLGTNIYWLSIHTIFVACIQLFVKSSSSSWTMLDFIFSDSFFIISIILVVLCLRMWKLYFDQSYAISSMQQMWKKQLNDSYSNWFIQNKKHYGSLKHCVIRFAIPIFVIFNAAAMLSTLYRRTCHTHHSHTTQFKHTL